MNAITFDKQYGLEQTLLHSVFVSPLSHPDLLVGFHSLAYPVVTGLSFHGNSEKMLPRLSSISSNSSTQACSNVRFPVGIGSGYPHFCAQSHRTPALSAGEPQEYVYSQKILQNEWQLCAFAGHLPMSERLIYKFLCIATNKEATINLRTHDIGPARD